MIGAKIYVAVVLMLSIYAAVPPFTQDPELRERRERRRDIAIVVVAIMIGAPAFWWMQ